MPYARTDILRVYAPNDMPDHTHIAVNDGTIWCSKFPLGPIMWSRRDWQHG